MKSVQKSGREALECLPPAVSGPVDRVLYGDCFQLLFGLELALIALLKGAHLAVFVQLVAQGARADAEQRSGLSPVALAGLERLHNQAALHLVHRHADVDAAVASIQEQGLEFESEPVDQPWLWREAHLRDPAGNRLCIYHAGENRRFPPWRLPGEEG